MIGTLLNFIAESVNQDICRRLKLPSSANKVQLSSIVDTQGSILENDSNVLLLKLIGIEPAPIANSFPTRIQKGSGINREEFAPLSLNLRIILASYSRPGLVREGLDMLTMGMSYFQEKKLWDIQNTPGLPKGVNRLVFEMEKLDIQELHQVWGAIGTNYLPSVMYTLKTIVINDQDIQDKISGITITPQNQE